MRHILLATVIVLATITELMAQTNDMETKFKLGITTKGNELFSSVANGRAWQTSDFQDRITYIAGIYAGLCLARREGLDWGRVNMPSGFSLSDLVDQIDIFYSDSANLRIPVIEAYVYTIRKLKGDSANESANFEALLRRTYNK